ncbi:uncharacterized protein LOC135844929 [Planococcus citri]|uniref:uncharacterized protein LOC135844929 n=1 Tax=Planococcus citri TaxID=170843 RepID=UPI0031F9A4C4
MKSIALAAVFSSALVFVAGQVSEQDEVHQKVVEREDEVYKQCKAEFPVDEDIRKKLARMVTKGETVPKDFHTTEWCNLYCNLEKLGFFDAQGKMQVRKIFKFVLKALPEIVPNSHSLLVHLFQIYRSTKDMEDECEKAFVAYYRFVEAVMAATIAADLKANEAISDKVVQEVLDGVTVPKDLEASMEKSLKNTEYFFDLTIMK